ncbi:MAG TPA: class I SAM-dependent methyltransferase [Thalassobaculum sp.]
MAEVDLLARLPRSKRNVQARQHARTDEHIRISREYGETYFDGPREYGYGGYRYDGRWVPIAEDMIAHFGLKPGMRVLDVGAAKGFLVKDFMIACPGLEAFGLDVSRYALDHCEPEVVGRLHLGDARSLPFPDGSFDAVVSINTLHNLPRDGVIAALREIMRVTRGRNAFVQVDSYRDEAQRLLFLDWVLTARFHDFPDGWVRLFDEAGYQGDHAWTIVE